MLNRETIIKDIELSARKTGAESADLSKLQETFGKMSLQDLVKYYKKLSGKDPQ